MRAVVTMAVEIPSADVRAIVFLLLVALLLIHSKKLQQAMAALFAGVTAGQLTLADLLVMAVYSFAFGMVLAWLCTVFGLKS